jgi:8-oxo-dGTP pyrophosphatase MutT (NUDIX family)
MKIDFPINTDVYTEYCKHCHKANTVQTVWVDEKRFYTCQACGKQAPQAIIIDPKINWWLDDTNTYYHESVGVILHNHKAQILVFELIKTPFGIAIPAGHVDKGESPLQAVIREAKEEVGVDLKSPKLIAETTVHNDSCRRGSDDHKWSLFSARLDSDTPLQVDDSEGKQSRWLTLEELKREPLAPAVAYLFNTYSSEIEAALKTDNER